MKPGFRYLNGMDQRLQPLQHHLYDHLLTSREFPGEHPADCGMGLLMQRSSYASGDLREVVDIGTAVRRGLT
jgi:hypothetical protein